MTQPDPLHARDAQERGEDAADAANQSFLVAALFFRARITWLDIESEADGTSTKSWRVRVPPQRGIVGHTKRLNDEMHDGARYSVAHGTDADGEYYTLVWRK